MHLIRSVPNAAIMFVSYEVVSNWLEKHSQPVQQPLQQNIGKRRRKRKDSNNKN